MIPKIIHHIAPKDRKLWHPLWNPCYMSWFDQYPEDEYKHILWNDREDIDNLVRDNYSQYFEFYNNLPYHIMKIDIARLLILHNMGGIYTDMDVFCYQNFFNDITKEITLMEASCDSEMVQNCLMSSIPNSNFIIECIEKIKDKFYNYNEKIPPVYVDNRYEFDNYIKEITGPHTLSEIYKNNPESIGLFNKENYNCNAKYYNKYLKTRHFLTGIWGSEIIKEFIFDYGVYDVDYVMSVSYQRFKDFDIQGIDFYKNYIDMDGEQIVHTT